MRYFLQMYEVKTLENIPAQTVFEVFTRSFAHYFVPMSPEPEVHLERWAWAGVDFSLSWGAFKNGELVAFALLAASDLELFNLATGVVPEHRGQKLTEKIFATIKPWAKEAGFRKISLEVIQANERGLKAYHSCGFARRRSLISLKGIVRIASAAHELSYRAKNYELSEEHFRLCAYPPSFEQDFPVLEKKKQLLEVHELRLNQELQAFAIFNPAQMNMVMLETKSEVLIPLLLQEMKLNGEEVGIINIDERNQTLIKGLKDRGLSAYIAQFEMGLRLD